MKIMTRINFGIPVVDLTDQHLLAEVRELPRIPRAVKANVLEGKEVKTLLGPFRLGTGHVTWFNNKLMYLQERYIQLYAECIKRGFRVGYDSDLFSLAQESSSMHDKLLLYYNDAQPTQIDIEVLKERIMTRIQDSKQNVRWYGKPMSKNQYLLEKLKI